MRSSSAQMVQLVQPPEWPGAATLAGSGDSPALGLELVVARSLARLRACCWHGSASLGTASFTTDLM